jgi:hypothetical protein
LPRAPEPEPAQDAGEGLHQACRPERKTEASG